MSDNICVVKKVYFGFCDDIMVGPYDSEGDVAIDLRNTGADPAEQVTIVSVRLPVGVNLSNADVDMFTFSNYEEIE